MADNLAIKDGTGTSKTLAAKDVASVYYPRHIMVAGTGTEIDFNTYLTAENAYLASIDTHVDGLEGQMGGLTETAPASDTASSGLNGRLQRIAQRLTSLIALLPSSIGAKTAANSLAVTLASDGTFASLAGSLTETAPASDTASSGLNGRLQRVAQRLTSILTALTDGSQITKPYAASGADWAYAAATGGIVSSTAGVTIKAAAGVGIRNYITSLQVNSQTLSGVNEVMIRDGASGTVLWRCCTGSTGMPNGMAITFPVPLKGSANTLLEVALANSTTGGVFVGAQGYSA